jgi:hypothetical protein
VPVSASTSLTIAVPPLTVSSFLKVLNGTCAHHTHHTAHLVVALGCCRRRVPLLGRLFEKSQKIGALACIRHARKVVLSGMKCFGSASQASSLLSSQMIPDDASGNE